jgi:23S rRNA pseudouridine1911/1915/1917 synthase
VLLKNEWVIYDDASLLVINKPSGWTVNSAETTKNQDTIEDLLPASDLPRRGIVHRLDKDTSGLLLVAKDSQSLTDLQRQFKERRVKKTYQTLVHGRVEPAAGTVRLPVARQTYNRHRFGVSIDGKPALTEYETIGIYPGYTLLLVRPKTGRTHQIRVHFKHLGHPVVSDPIYGGKKALKGDFSWCPRLFLHSYQIEFAHPKTHKTINLTVPLPDDLQTALKKIKVS